jgi:hypothetical protein
MRKNLLIFGEFDSSNIGLERELSDTFKTEIIPQENFIGGKLRLLATSNQCQDVSPKHHFDDPDSSVEF